MVKDWLHFVLICGIVNSIILLTYLAFTLYDQGCKSALCWEELFAPAFILPSTKSFIVMIGSYDEQLSAAEERHKQAEAEFIGAINQMATETNGWIEDMAQFADYWARERFLERVQGLQSFLRGFCEPVIIQLADTTANAELLEQFKRFLEHWIRTFTKSILLDRQDMLQDIRKCNSVPEVCEVVKSF